MLPALIFWSKCYDALPNDQEAIWWAQATNAHVLNESWMTKESPVVVCFCWGENYISTAGMQQQVNRLNDLLQCRCILIKIKQNTFFLKQTYSLSVFFSNEQIKSLNSLCCGQTIGRLLSQLWKWFTIFVRNQFWMEWWNENCSINDKVARNACSEENVAFYWTKIWYHWTKHKVHLKKRDYS